MQIFREFSFGWKGTDYRIPPNRVLEAIARVEDHLTLAELHQAAQREAAPPLAKLAMAYGALLRYAGAQVSDDEVYAGMFPASEAAAEEIVMAVNGLLQLMVPAHLLNGAGGAAPPGNLKPAEERRSPRRSRR